MNPFVIASRRVWFVAALVFFTVSALSPVAVWLESTMVGHILIQIPLLVVVGVVLGHAIAPTDPAKASVWNAGGYAGILVASFTVVFWMLPRWLDAAINDELVMWAKYLTVPLLVGVPLVWSWPRLPLVARAVVKIELITMLLRLGWLYLISPDRLCNSYLLQDQVWLGRGFLLIAISLVVTWLIPVIFGEAWSKPIARNAAR